MGWPAYDGDDVSSFWNRVAQTGRYSDEPQTWEWETDLRKAKQIAKKSNPEVLVAYGCADGCRDPEQLIEVAEDAGRSVKKVIAVDCTELFAEDVRDRVKKWDLEFDFLLNN